MMLMPLWQRALNAEIQTHATNEAKRRRTGTGCHALWERDQSDARATRSAVRPSLQKSRATLGASTPRNAMA
eukprot:4118441-Lingulodinium_polyedra.AAC.1